MRITIARTARKMGILLTIGALAAATAACGSNSKSTGGSTAAGDLKGQNLEVIAEWSGAEQASFQAVLDGFTKKTGAKITYTSGGDNTSVLVNSRVAGGNPPDVALIAQPGAVVQLPQKNQIFPLTGDALSAAQGNFIDAWQKLGTLDGKPYGVFFKAANKSVVWYSTKAFSDAGVQPPATWDDFTTRVEDAGRLGHRRRWPSRPVTAGLRPTGSRTSTCAPPAWTSTTS